MMMASPIRPAGDIRSVPDLDLDLLDATSEVLPAPLTSNDSDENEPVTPITESFDMSAAYVLPGAERAFRFSANPEFI